MSKYRVRLNDPVYATLLTKCTNRRWVDLGRRIHFHLHESGEIDIVLKNCLINMYGKCGYLEEAVELFNSTRVSERTAITWCALLSAYGERGRGKDAWRAFEEMQRQGIKPTDKVVSCVLKASSDPSSVNTAIEFLFSMEKKLGIKPDHYHYTCVLNACANNVLLALGKMVHNHLIENKNTQDIVLKTNLINMYAKCGALEEALNIFNSIDKREGNVITWNTIISAYGLKGNGTEALRMFNQMIRDGLRPDSTTFVTVLNACSHARLVKEALDIFYNMESKYNVRPEIIHCNCIVDLFGRVGRIEEAESFISNYMMKHKIEPDVITWTSLLTSSRARKDVERAERYAQFIMDMDPSDIYVYFQLSNLYLQTGNMEKRKRLRELMNTKGLKAATAFSTVEVNNQLYRFESEDNFHPNIKEIHHELQVLNEEMIQIGYQPELSAMTRDIECEEERKDTLCHHSEKLAIAWALMNTPPGTAIRLTKNLRICADCHTIIKFISKIRNREIIVKDASRYHHIKYGKCSCGDYW